MVGTVTVNLRSVHAVAMWTLGDEEQPLQDRYFMCVVDGSVVPIDKNIVHVGSLNAQGAGIHVFEIKKG